MGVPGERVVLLRGLLPAGKLSVGSGTLVGPSLVLTAAHVVFGGDGAPLPKIEVEPESGGRFGGRVVWPERYVESGDPDARRDAALVSIEDPFWVPAALGPVRWGRFTGRSLVPGCEAVGFPRVAKHPQGARLSDPVVGSVAPPQQKGGGRLVLHVATSLPKELEGQPSPWAGASGAGLFAGGLLAGVLVVHEGNYEGRLSALPVHRLAADEGFTTKLAEHGGGELSPDSVRSVELDECLVSARYQPLPPAPCLSPAQLLKADFGLVRFYGPERIEELEAFERWCGTDDVFSLRVLWGPAGQGKTRFARELAKKLSERKTNGDEARAWVTGFVPSRASPIAIMRLATTEAPTLLIIDYAEDRQRREQLDALDALVPRFEGHQRVRVLLLGRSVGEWWTRCRQGQKDLAENADLLQLHAIVSSASQRGVWFKEAVETFARRAAGAGFLKIPATDAVKKLTAQELETDPYANPLTLQMAAVLALMDDASFAETGPRPLIGKIEESLLCHEMRYWESVAQSHDLGLHSTTRSVAVGVAVLAKASDQDQAIEILRRVKRFSKESDDRLAAVASWLHDLYPPHSQSSYWGSLQPDRLAEHLVSQLWEEHPDWVFELIVGASDEQKAAAVSFLGRAWERYPTIKAKLPQLLEAEKEHLLAPVVSALKANGKSSKLGLKTADQIYSDFLKAPMELL